MSPVTGTRSVADQAAPERERLQAAMQQLEGVFVQQLFKAMRETVPNEGVVSGGSGEEIFTGLLDERLSSLVPAAWKHDGMEEALLRQFRGALPDGGCASARRSDSVARTASQPSGPEA